MYGNWLAAPRNADIFNATEKILIRQTGDSIIAVIVENGFIARDNLHIILPQNPLFNLKYVLAIVNSKLTDFIYTTMNPEKGEALAQVKKQHVENLILRDISISEQQPFITLVDKILAEKKAGNDTRALEREIDVLVYGLYGLTEDEIRIIEGGK
ncbi:hypothetical protein LBMAG43_00430 [Methylococcaceae bacterium]|nr:hypothetical protein LBMAG43_00430 [Methylococcaceae bacterium]